MLTTFQGDGSKEWTPEWLQKLDHRFGDDGDFWISYKDFLRKYQIIERTRLFDGPEWSVTQLWTTLEVPWLAEYLETYFHFSIARPGPVVLVLSQLDDRYFRGLEGQYSFDMSFRVHKAGEEAYLVRSRRSYRMSRSVNIEYDLDAGEYDVRIRINATKYESVLPIEEVIRNNAKTRPQKLTRIGTAYDLAHARGVVVESEAEAAERAAWEEKNLKKMRDEIKSSILASREREHYKKTKEKQRERKEELRRKEKMKGKEAKRKVDIQPKAARPDGGEEKVSKLDELVKKDNEDEDREQEEDVASLAALSDLSEREIDMLIEAELNGDGEGEGDYPESEAGSEASDEFTKDPWNATAVVGLRIYHKFAKEEDGKEPVQLNAVRPKEYKEDEEEEAGAETVQDGPDVDDGVKDATLEGDEQEKKESIIKEEATA